MPVLTQPRGYNCGIFQYVNQIDCHIIWHWSDRRPIRLDYDVIISSQFRVKLFAWFHFLISRTLVSASLIEICILKSLSCILRIFF